MWKTTTMVLAVTLSAASGCATFAGNREPDPAGDLAAGLEASAAEDFAGARALLLPVYRQHWASPVGQQALLALAALEVDPRNPERRPEAAAELLARYLGIEAAPEWTVPVAESLYLVALELGGEPAAARVEADAAREAELRPEAPTRHLPQLPGPTVPARLAAAGEAQDRLREERDEVQRRLQQLERQMAARDSVIRVRDQEIERIRRLIGG
jgi:hypothetical protein